MTAAVFADELGPRAKRRVRIASIVAGVLVAGAVLGALKRLSDKGQLDESLWRPLTQSSVMRFLLGGLANTAKAAAMAMVLAVLVGALMALGRLARSAPVRWLAGIYVEFFRAVPLLLLILFSALALPKYGVDLDAYWYLVVPLVAYNSAVLGEIFRAGILSLERGQSEAGLSLGMTYWQTMLTVVVPQAARRMIPAIVSQLVTLLKDTSLGFVIPYEELLRRSRSTGEFFRNPLQTLVVIAATYFVVNFSLSRVARRLEVRQRRRYSAGSISVGGVEDLAVVAAQGEGDQRRA
jgi:glutamate transport system permease protein